MSLNNLRFLLLLEAYFPDSFYSQGQSDVDQNYRPKRHRISFHEESNYQNKYGDDDISAKMGQQKYGFEFVLVSLGLLNGLGSWYPAVGTGQQKVANKEQYDLDQWLIVSFGPHDEVNGAAHDEHQISDGFAVMLKFYNLK